MSGDLRGSAVDSVGVGRGARRNPASAARLARLARRSAVVVDRSKRVGQRDARSSTNRAALDPAHCARPPWATTAPAEPTRWRSCFGSEEQASEVGAAQRPGQRRSARIALVHPLASGVRLRRHREARERPKLLTGRRVTWACHDRGSPVKLPRRLAHGPLSNASAHEATVPVAPASGPRQASTTDMVRLSGAASSGRAPISMMTGT
jgi:hypothetical protein